MDPQRRPKLDGLGDRVAAILHDVVDYHVAVHDQPRIPDAYNLESEVDREAEHGGIMECLGCGVQPHVCEVVFGSSANQLLQRSMELKPCCAFLKCCSHQHAPRLRQSCRSFRRMSCSHCFLLHSSPKHDLQGMQVLEQLADRILDRRLIERLHDLSEGLGINKSFAVALSDIHFLNILAEAQKEARSHPPLGIHDNHGRKDIEQTKLDDRCEALRPTLRLLAADIANLQSQKMEIVVDRDIL